MISSNQGETKIEGQLIDIMFEFDEIMRIMIKHHPEIVQVSSILFSEEIINAPVNVVAYNMCHTMLQGKHQMDDMEDYSDENPLL